MTTICSRQPPPLCVLTLNFIWVARFTVIKLTSFWMNLNCFAPRRQLVWSRRWRGGGGVWSRVDCVKGFLSSLFLIALRKFWLCLTVLRNNYAKWSRGRERDSNMRNAVSGGLKRIKWHTASLFLCVCACYGDLCTLSHPKFVQQQQLQADWRMHVAQDM